MLRPSALDSRQLARTIRLDVLEMIYRAKASHIGSCYSAADILAVLYARALRYDVSQPAHPERDRLILSKGHAGAVLYAALAEVGFFPKAWLDTYCQDGTRLAGHIVHHDVPGVEVSSGSLGHGLGIGCGMALAAQRAGRAGRVFVILSDGECDEGSTWEAALFAPAHRLDNLTIIVDYNKIQSFGTVEAVMPLEPFADKWRAFGWAVREIDGHDHAALADTFAALPFEAGKPSAVIAHTVKGKGVRFMENELAWHYKPPNDAEYAQAREELSA